MVKWLVTALRTFAVNMGTSTLQRRAYHQEHPGSLEDKGNIT